MDATFLIQYVNLPFRELRPLIFRVINKQCWLILVICYVLIFLFWFINLGWLISCVFLGVVNHLFGLQLFYSTFYRSVMVYKHCLKLFLSWNVLVDLVESFTGYSSLDWDLWILRRCTAFFWLSESPLKSQVWF